MSIEPAIKPRLTPPLAKGNVSSAVVKKAWYVACRSRQLKNKPYAVTILGQPLVLFRDGSGQPHCVLDRCPHRNVPLSMGKIVDGELECAYHGWRFNGCGDCTRVPGLANQEASVGRNVPSWPVVEQQDLVWVYADCDSEPETAPFLIPHYREAGYHTVVDIVEARGTLHSVAENALDVPHTAFLHGGLFRSDRERRPIDVIIRRGPDRAEVQYIGEEAPKGLVGRLLAPGGGEVEHYDRFIMPCIVQVDYRLGARSHMYITTALTPIDDFNTRLFAVISFRLPFPGWLVSFALKPVARHIFRQDARMLDAQSENILRYGGEQFVSTELDAIGPHILRLLRSAERGSTAVGDEVFEKRIQMLV